MAELCGCVIRFASHRTYCALPIDHDGPCVPSRNELLNVAERMEKDAQDIYDDVTRWDISGYAWPYEGPAK